MFQTKQLLSLSSIKSALGIYTLYDLPDLSGMSMAGSDVTKVADILHSLDPGTHFSVQFIKRKDNSYRQLNCIAGVGFNHITGKSPYHAGSRDLFPVFHVGDPDKDDPAGVRNIPLDRVLCVNVKPIGGEPIHHHTPLYSDPRIHETMVKRSANIAIKDGEADGVSSIVIDAIRSRVDQIIAEGTPDVIESIRM